MKSSVHSRSVLLGASFLIALSASSLAIGMRHDVDEGEYVALAANADGYEAGRYPDFAAVGAIGLPARQESFEVMGSGTLVARRWVLTAAHVVLARNPRKGDFVEGLRVRFGSSVTDQEAEYTVTEIRTILPGEKLRPLLGRGNRYTEAQVVHAELHDLALLKLDRPVEGIRPAAWNDRRASLAGRLTYIAGFGAATPGNNPDEKTWTPPSLKRAAENVIDRDIPFNPLNGKAEGGMIVFDFDSGDAERNSLGPGASKAWNFLFGTGTSSERPASMEGASYPADSGGPAFVLIDGGWRLAGVSGYGTGYPADRHHSSIQYGEIQVYTRVASHAGWIAKIAGPLVVYSAAPGAKQFQLPPLPVVADASE